MMMSAEELTRRFETRLRYRRARSWQKPFLDPKRFFRNQLWKYGIRSLAPGKLRTVDSFQLDEFTIVSGEKVSQTIAGYGVYEERLTEAFIRLVRPGQIVLDIGMHLGYYTALFAQLVGKRGHVHAFEPTPTTREIAANNLRTFDWVTVHPFAAWSAITTITFQDYGLEWMAFNSIAQSPPEEAIASRKQIEVRTITLDAFRQELGKPISLIKIDAESAEMEILRGAAVLLAMDKPIISLEVGDAAGKPSSRALVEWMESAGFRPWEFIDGRFVRHNRQDQYQYDNVLFAVSSSDLGRF